MSHPRSRKKPAADPAPAPVSPRPVVAVAEPAPEALLGLFAPAAVSEMMIEGFARAFERKMQGASMEVLTEALQLAADLRVFKEGLFLTGEQVVKLLQISERTFDRYKEEKKIEVDPHIGPGSLRFSLFSILEARAKSIREAKPAKGT